MTQEAHQPAVKSAATYFARGVDRCYRCDYDLRGIADGQPCPECGLPASESRHRSDALRDSHPAWLRRISIGLWLILLATLIGSGGPIFLALLEAWIRRGSSPVSPMAAGLIFYAGLLLAPTLLIAGVWLITCPEQIKTYDDLDRAFRRRLRVYSVLPLLNLFALGAALLVVGRLKVDRAGDYLEVAIVAISAVASFLPFAIFTRLRNLARRAKSNYLAGRCVDCGLGFSISFLWGILVFVMSTHPHLFGLLEHWGEHGTSTIAVFSAVISPLIFGAWACTILFRFAIRFYSISSRRKFEWTIKDRLLEHSLQNRLIDAGGTRDAKR